MVTQMQQAHRRAPSRHHAMGFGLVEVMVGVVIGMAGVIIMLQMLSNAESAKRVTAGGNDAEVNGAIALYGLERDLRAAGYGLNAYTLLGCSLAYTSMDMQHAVGDGADDDSDDDLTLWQYLGKALWQKRKQDEEDTSMYDTMRKQD